MAKVEREDPEVQIPGQFEEFYREEYPSVVALTYGLGGSTWAAEDLAQEAFLRAHSVWGRVGQMSAPDAWVKRVAMNLAMSRFRRTRAEMAARLRMLPAPPSLEPGTPVSEAFWSEVRQLPRRQARSALHRGALCGRDQRRASGC